MEDQENRQNAAASDSPPAPETPAEPAFTNEDIEKGKTMAGLSYLLFFLPLVACPESRYARFHANQSLILLIVSIAGNIILGIIPIVGWILLPFFGIAVLVFAVLGMVNGFGGKARRLPLIGGFELIR
jgi:uncharacterized membrane protein